MLMRVSNARLVQPSHTATAVVAAGSRAVIVSVGTMIAFKSWHIEQPRRTGCSSCVKHSTAATLQHSKHTLCLVRHTHMLS
jgi:hypothetical protein